MSAGRFVWIETGVGTLTCERWPADAPSGGTGGRKIVASHELGDDMMALPLNALAKMYPAPEWSPKP